MLRFVIDENLRGALWQAIQTHNSSAEYPISAVRVGDIAALPLGIKDPEIIEWSEQHRRILVSFDHSSLPEHLNAHLAKGRHSPGIFVVRAGSSLSKVVAFLASAAWASQPSEWRDRIEYIP